jgi:hypothetical protein
MVQEGFATQWGPKGRDDLQLMKTMGGNAVRLYHSIGLETEHDHGKFLDRAYELGMHVFVGIHTQLPCPDFDCFEAVKNATTAAFAKGFKKGKDWHPAVSMLILLNEPDTLNFGGNPPPVCEDGKDAECRVRAALSTMDGVLAAEAAAGMSTKLNMTITWSFDQRDSIDGKVKAAIGYYGFQDMVAATAKPSLAKYSPRANDSELSTAFDNRWTHSVNTHSPWAFVKEMIDKNYGPFQPKPWFLGEFRGDGLNSAQVEADLKAMHSYAQTNPWFLGVNLFRFTENYQDQLPYKYGLFTLGDDSLGEQEICTEDVNFHTSTCADYQAYCLKQASSKRARATVRAWKGKVEGPGLCKLPNTTQVSAGFLTRNNEVQETEKEPEEEEVDVQHTQKGVEKQSVKEQNAVTESLAV